MKLLPKDVLAILEEFWAEEYESDYRRYSEGEEPQKTLMKPSLDLKSEEKIAAF